MCTKNQNQMIHGSWETEWDRQNFLLSFRPFFCLFTLLIIQKSEFFKNKKNSWRYYPFTHVYHKWRSDNIWFLKWKTRHIFFCHFGPVFVFSPFWQPRKSKFWKIEENTWRCYHFTHVNHKWKSNDAWLLKYGAQQIFFFFFLSFWTVFCAFVSL